MVSKKCLLIKCFGIIVVLFFLCVNSLFKFFELEFVIIYFILGKDFRKFRYWFLVLNCI